MSVNTTSKDKNDTIDRAISMALNVDVNSAIAVLNQSELTEDHKTKIALILKEPRSDNQEQTIDAMRQRIVAVVKNIASTDASSQAPSEQQCIDELCSDVMGRIFNTCVSECGFETLAVLARVSKHWNNCLPNFWAGCELKQLCPELTILDAETQGAKCEEEPKIDKIQLMKWVREISPNVEGNAGVTLLTMTKGTTLNQLIEIAKGEGIIIDVQWDQIIEELEMFL